MEGEDGKVRDIDGKLVGAQLFEFDLATGLMKTKDVEVEEDGETYTEKVNIYDEGTGYCSQYRRQSACFSKSNPDKMYWEGFYNSGKGINSYGSWSSLPDYDKATGQTWRDNKKYDTCLYEVDINTGEATRLASIKNRFWFSCIWVEDDNAGDDVDGIENLRPSAGKNVSGTAYNLSGQRVSDGYRGIVIIDGQKRVRK